MSEKSYNDRINREFRSGENLGTADRRYAEFRIQRLILIRIEDSVRIQYRRRRLQIGNLGTGRSERD